MKGQTLDKWNGKPWRQSVFEGVPILQTPVDLWLFTELVERVVPSYIVEVGMFKGGFTRWLLRLTSQTRTTIVGVDVEIPHGLPMSRRLAAIQGDSIESCGIVRDRIERGTGHKIIILDDDHEPAHVLGELDNYSEMCEPGDWIVVCDTVPVPGLEEAVGRWLDTVGAKDGWRTMPVDRFGLSNNRGGWLRKGERCSIDT